MRLTEGLAGLVAEQLRPQLGRRRHDAPAVQVLPRSRRGSVPLVPGRAGRRPRPAAGRAGACRRSSRASSAPTTCGCWSTAGAQVAPDRRRSAHARPVRRARAPAAAARSRRTCGGAGTHEPTSLFRELDPVLLARARPQPDRAAPADPDRDARGARVAARAAQPHQLRLPPHAGVPRSRRTPGARATPACSGRGRWPTSRPSSGCTSRCRSTPAAWASWPATTSRAPRTWACRWSASASTTTRATSGSGSTATAGSTRTTSTSTAGCCRCSRRSRRRRSRSWCRSRPAPAPIAARVWRLAVGRNTLLLLDSDVEGNQPEDRELTARLYGGDSASASARSCCSASAACARSTRWASRRASLHLNEGHSAFAALELVRQRMDERRHRRVARRCAASRAGRLHHPHAGAAGHDRFSRAT